MWFDCGGVTGTEVSMYFADSSNNLRINRLSIFGYDASCPETAASDAISVPDISLTVLQTHQLTDLTLETSNCGKASYSPLTDYTWLSIEVDAADSSLMILTVAPTTNAEAGTHLVTLEMNLEDYPDNAVTEITFTVEILEARNQAPMFTTDPVELLTFQ